MTRFPEHHMRDLPMVASAPLDILRAVGHALMAFFRSASHRRQLQKYRPEKLGRDPNAGKQHLIDCASAKRI